MFAPAVHVPERRSARISFSPWLALAYAALLLYGSVYPLSGWRDMGLPSLTFLGARFPRYWTAFDLAVNVLLYLPLGFLLARSFGKRCRPWLAFILAALLGAAFSLLIEWIQNWLPSRVPSNVDLLCNALGGLFGACLAVCFGAFLNAAAQALSSKVLSKERNTPFGLIVFLLWLVIQFSPEGLLFASGDWRFLLPPEVTLPYQVQQLPWLESAVVTAFMLAAGLLLRQLISFGYWRTLPLLSLIFLCTLTVRSLASAFILEPAAAFDWLTIGAQRGLLAGALALLLVCALPRHWRARIALGSVLLGVLVLNLTPISPYLPDVVLRWQQGPYQNFVGLLRWLAGLWPVALVSYFSAVAWQRKC